jgi:hypothetical protein
MQGYSIATYGNQLLLLLVSVAGLLHYKKLNTPFKILVISMICSFGTAILSDIWIAKYKTNAPVLHIEAITQFVLYCAPFYYLFINPYLKKSVIIAIIALTIFSVINAILLQPLNKVFPTYVNLSTLAILAVFSLLLFKQMLLYPLKTPLLRQGVFWYNTAIIFYSTTMFLNIGLSNVYIRNPSIDYFVFYVWYSILYIFTILIAIAVISDSKETNKSYAL